MKDSSGELLQARNDIRKRRKEHFEQLYNVQNPTDNGTLFSIMRLSAIVNLQNYDFSLGDSGSTLHI